MKVAAVDRSRRCFMQSEGHCSSRITRARAHHTVVVGWASAHKDPAGGTGRFRTGDAGIRDFVMRLPFAVEALTCSATEVSRGALGTGTLGWRTAPADCLSDRAGLGRPTRAAGAGGAVLHRVTVKSLYRYLLGGDRASASCSGMKLLRRVQHSGFLRARARGRFENITR